MLKHELSYFGETFGLALEIFSSLDFCDYIILEITKLIKIKMIFQTLRLKSRFVFCLHWTFKSQSFCRHLLL